MNKLIGLLSLVVLVVGCGGDYIYTPPPENPPVKKVSLTLRGVGFDAHDGQNALVRIKSGPDYLWCGDAGVIDGGRFTLELSEVLIDGQGWDAEIVGNANGDDDTFDPTSGDRSYYIEYPTTTGATDVEVNPVETVLDHWPAGQAVCP
jgi:hypothetical protein